MPAPLARLIATGVIKYLIDEGEEDVEEITVPVSSSAIRTIGYRGDGVITVEFHRGGTYSYAGSKELFLEFAAAQSKGQFFNANFQTR